MRLAPPPSPPTSTADEAILRTLLYADLFDYPLTPHEIHHYLIATPATDIAVQAALACSPWVAAHTTQTRGYVALRGRQALGALREARRQSSAALWPVARRWAAVLGWLPFVRMVAVTGALAVDNAPEGDDVDFLIVTAPGRVWLARALTVLVVRLARLAGVGLCPNYVLAETALAQQRRDLFSAHDLVQMVVLVGQDTGAAMLKANAWTAEYLPQATRPLRTEQDLGPRGWAWRWQRLGEWLLGGRVGNALEAWERRRKLARFAPAARQPGSAAELDEERVKGHFEDHGYPILQRFEARVRQFQVESAMMPAGSND
jgi:hypothetical protein